MFYERYLQLCEEKKIAPSAAATKAGFNRGTVSVWKKKYEAGMDVNPDQDIVNKICDFFGCTESWIRGISERKEKPPVGDERFLPLAERREALSKAGIHILLDADAKVTEEQLDDIISFIEIQQRRNGR